MYEYTIEAMKKGELISLVACTYLGNKAEFDSEWCHPLRYTENNFVSLQTERKVRLNEIIRRNSQHAALVLV